MIKLENITNVYPQFSSQLENKILYTSHSEDISIAYKSTYTLKYVIEGTKHYQFNNQSIRVSKNQYLLLNNDKTIQTEAQKGTKGLSFFLSPELVNEIYSYHTRDASQEFPLEFYECAQLKSNNNIGFWLDKITNQLAQGPFVFHQKSDDLFLKLSEAIIKEQIIVDGKFIDLNIIKYNTKKELYKFISLTKEFINDNSNDTISLDIISNNIGVSKYYLHRVFSKITGSTPLGYLTYTRLIKAKNKLQYSKDSIFEIAIECGFENTSYFSTVFKKNIGCSPSYYRTNSFI